MTAAHNIGRGIAQLLARAVEADKNLRREVLALVLRRLAGPGPEDSAVD